MDKQKIELWIKSSKRLPKFNQNVFVRYWGGVMGVGVWYGSYFSEDSKGNIGNDFEWLDESQIYLSQQRIEELEKENRELR